MSADCSGLHISLNAAPDDGVGWRNGDHWPRFDRHGTILRILSTEQAHGDSVRLSLDEDSRSPEDENVAELFPIFFIMINDNRHRRILFDIAYPLELVRSGAFGLFIDGRAKVFAVEGKAYGNDVWVTGSIRRCEMSDPCGAN